MVNFNGSLVEAKNAQVSLNNRAFNYGDAVFETLRILNGKIFFWEDHYFRLMASMRILRMEIPMNFTMEYLEEEILKTYKSVDPLQNSFRAKLIVWRESGGRYTPDSNEIGYSIGVESLTEQSYILNNNPCEIELFKDYYVPANLLSTLKSTNRLVNILGGIFASENGYQNCLLLNEHKQVVEALNGNIFIISDSVIKTPPLADGCLNGVLRKQLLSILKKLPAYQVKEEFISPFELQKADELFITNVISGIIPVTKYRKKEYGNVVAAELLPLLNLRAIAS
ncbi:MAG TPA: aminotransferase class IV [Aequorivita sp.]|nr:aminotransferase class IV [Aequorivita sp.]